MIDYMVLLNDFTILSVNNIRYELHLICVNDKLNQMIKKKETSAKKKWIGYGRLLIYLIIFMCNKDKQSNDFLSIFVSRKCGINF